MEDIDLKSSPTLDAALEHESGRNLVYRHYQGLLKEQKDQPDPVFIDGHTFQELDPNLVVLDGDASEHPRTWTFKKKVRTTAVIAAFCFISPFASTIFAPSVHLVMEGLHITNGTLGSLQLSIFLFAFAVGLLFLAPLSEMYGRAIIIHLGNLVFIAFSVGAGFAQTPAQFSVCRFLGGLGGSAGLAVVGGCVADIWDLEARPKASGIVMLGPILGPILGPLIGGWMSQGASWRWTLWLTAIASGVIAIAGLLWLPETYAPRILENKLRKVCVACSNDHLYTVLDLRPRPAGFGYLFSRFVRPVAYLALDPALVLASAFYSYASVFALGYGHSVGIVGTDFLAVGIGMIIGTIGTIKAMDAIFKKNGPEAKKNYKPESRLLSCIVGGALSIGGLFMYGFSALRTHFMVPLVGIAIFAMGSMNIMMAIQLYTIDGFKYPASAFAAISVTRCIFAGAFPLFGPDLFEKLGIDWGVALLAFLILGIGLPLVLLLYVFGPRLRKIGVARYEKFEGTSE
ncbi:MFS general substrate transporter [Lojkania enalia]|uniref:MFS general substrate transporter n=1 Tax=Lojkania enalia TaxID=147567 RepID=A0A9P4NAC6_9PLEO|nr:MFS general substrate transporter [Didymosphaeria enalia]